MEANGFHRNTDGDLYRFLILPTFLKALGLVIGGGAGPLGLLLAAPKKHVKNKGGQWMHPSYHP